MLHAWRFLTLLLAALGLGPGLAHVLELPPKMEYDRQMYMAVTSTLYRLFGLVGGPIQVGAFLAAVVLTILVRRRPAFGATLIGTLGLALSLGLWTALVSPVNAEWAEALRTSPATAAAAYQELRPRWEYGHVAAFAAWLAGFSVLLYSVVRETSGEGGSAPELSNS